MWQISQQLLEKERAALDINKCGCGISVLIDLTVKKSNVEGDISQFSGETRKLKKIHQQQDSGTVHEDIHLI